MGEALLANLGDTNWKIRLEAIEKAITLLLEDKVDPELGVLIMLSLPTWKDNNFQVQGKVLQYLGKLSEESGFSHPFDEAAVHHGIALPAEKLGDAKVKQAATEVLDQWSQKTSFGYVLQKAYPTFESQKAPKIIAECIKWVQTALQGFGTQGVELKQLIKFAKTMVANPQPAVRSAAVALLVELRILIGPALRDMLNGGEISSAVLSTLDAEFAKVADQPSYKGTKPQKRFADQKAPPRRTQGASSEALAPAPAAAEEVDLDALLPRVNIADQINDALMEKLGDPNWKLRKEGLDEVQTILDNASKRVGPDVGDLLTALKQRLSDANKMLVLQTLSLLAVLAPAMGRAFDRPARAFLSDIFLCFNDNKPQVRQATAACLTACCPLMTTHPYVTDAVKEALALEKSPNIRSGTLQWLSTFFTTRADLLPLILPMAKCLQDKNGDVRKASQAALVYATGVVGYETVKADIKGPLAPIAAPFIDPLKSSPSLSPAKSATLAPTAPPPPAGAAASSLKLKKPASQAQLAEPVTAPTEEAEQRKSCPLVTADARAKEKRADADRGPTKWHFDGAAIRPELIDFLKEQAQPHFAPALWQLLFSTTQYKERDHMQGLTTLVEALSLTEEGCQDTFGLSLADVHVRFEANADLLLKYLTVRLLDPSTTMFLKTLDLMDLLFGVLDRLSYHITDYEASAFLPSFIHKVGDPKEMMRQRVRGLMKQFCRIYPVSKMFAYLLDGTRSKNAKTRLECLDELGSLMQRNGLTICSPTKSLPLIAMHIADRDAGVRNAAMNTLVIAHLIAGDVFKYLKLDEKERSMLEERIKRSASSLTTTLSSTALASSSSQLQAPKEVEEAPPAGTKSRKPFSLDLEQIEKQLGILDFVSAQWYI